jgi:hypothetical protein
MLQGEQSLVLACLSEAETETEDETQRLPPSLSMNAATCSACARTRRNIGEEAGSPIANAHTTERDGCRPTYCREPLDMVEGRCVVGVPWDDEDGVLHQWRDPVGWRKTEVAGKSV